MAIIKQLKNGNGETLYPKTTASAVYDNTGRTIEELSINSVYMDEADNEYVEPLDRVDAKDVQNALNEHTGDESNPHNVTKSQIGLENVDNTSDADKPISTAVQTALDAKAPSYSYGTTDLTAGSSSLTSGNLHFVYE